MSPLAYSKLLTPRNIILGSLLLLALPLVVISSLNRQETRQRAANNNPIPTPLTQLNNPLATVASSLTSDGIGKITNRDLLQTSDGTLHTFVQTKGNTTNCPTPPTGQFNRLMWLTSLDQGATWNCKGLIQGLDLKNVGGNSDIPSAVVDGDDNIYVIYSKYSTNFGGGVFYRKLTQVKKEHVDNRDQDKPDTSGKKDKNFGWEVGPEQTVLTYIPSKTNYAQAVLAIDGTNKLWVAVQKIDLTTGNLGAALRSTEVYYASDLSNAPIWTISTVLDTPSNTYPAHVPVILHYANKLAVIYTSEGKTYAWRTRMDSDPLTTWAPQTTITTLVGPYANPYFQAAADDAGNVHMVFSNNSASSDSQITHMYFNQSTQQWSDKVAINPGNAANAFPSLTTDGSNVYVFYGTRPKVIGKGFGWSGTTLGNYAYKVGKPPYLASDFGPEKLVNNSDRFFDQVYTQTATGYAQQPLNCRTTPLPLVSQLNDAVYFGHKTPYRTIIGSLDRAGVGGTVVYEYWNGTAWTLLPATNIEEQSSPNFTRKAVYGYGLMFIPPTNWAPTELDATNAPGSHYYIRARATKIYTTQPASLCFWNFPDGNSIQLPTKVSNTFIPLIWNETIYGSGKSAIRFSAVSN